MAVVTGGMLIGGALISGGMQLIGGLFGMSAAKRKEEAAARERKKLQAKLTSLENSRQEIINPYEGVTDLSGMISNPYDSLGVATQAAEIQIEQADISLANTLDTIRSTGASAGGATALAQAALQSKKGVSATIEAQEANNENARARGEEIQQQRQMAEAQRVQQADVAGEQFQFSVREGRQAEQLDRVSAQLSGSEARGAQASADRMGALTGMVGGLASTAGSYLSAASSANNLGKQGYGGFDSTSTSGSGFTPPPFSTRLN
jgi:hypothetical protein